jgi:hypothetical protein
MTEPLTDDYVSWVAELQDARPTPGATILSAVEEFLARFVAYPSEPRVWLTCSGSRTHGSWMSGTPRPGSRS